MAAAVSIDPTTGRVIAYYGGENGTGTDYAGYNWEGGKRTGGHSPGSSFKIYTLAAALREGISFQTLWDASKVKDPPFTLSNANRVPSCKTSCTLEDSTKQSYNVPFYWLTKAIGPDKVVDAARLAGVHWMWGSDPDKPDAFDLSTRDPKELAPGDFISHVGFGQYPVTVLGHANGVATFAARGVYREAHFVVEVKQKDAKGQWKKVNGEKVVPKQVFEPSQVDDITAVLEDYPGKGPLSGGRQSARKTGTWEQKAGSAENGDAWMVGYTPQIATAVWVGNVKGREALKYAPNISNPKSLTRVQGGNLPAEIWKRFMDEAHKGLPEKVFPDRKNTGRDDHPAANGTSPTPALPNCPFPITIPGVCTEPPRGGGPGNGGGGPGGGG
jgi:membrane peptidoglycan carboxypeptidase